MNKLTNIVVVLFVCFQYSAINSQSKIEKQIQGFGDVFQVALLISVGLTTIINDDNEGSSYIFTTRNQKEDIKITFSSQNKKFLLGLRYNF